MAGTPSTSGRPDTTDLRESVERVEGAVLRGIRVQSSRRHRFQIGLAALSGIALFAGGVAVGGAALAPAAGSSTGGTPVFTVDCYSSVGGHRTSSVSFTALTVYTDLKKEPASVCVSLASSSGEVTVLEGTIARLNAKGTLCGLINIHGGNTWYFDGDGRSDDSQELSVRPGCGVLYSANAPHQRPLTACRVSDDRAVVYPLGKATADVVCHRVGLTVWNK
jgi:hypothetical protein